MSDRPTPETDAETMRDEYDHVDSDIGPFTPSDTVPAEFARKLERERDEARELAEAYKEYAQLLGAEINDMVIHAHVHGLKFSRFEQGKVLHEKIKQLEKKK